MNWPLFNLLINFKQIEKGNTYKMSDTVIEMQQITKKFGSFTANNQVNLAVESGEIHALLGENGAGKSTLMNMLTGLLQPTSGRILMHGQEVKVKNPAVATRLGIGMVHQHFMLVEAFTVTENIILGNEDSKFGQLDLKQARARVLALSEKYQLQVDPDAKIADISVGQQQRVEILKILYRGADVLVFDEPTAVLTPQEIAELIKIMQQLAQEGKAIILITHKLDEIKAAANRVTVIRAGESIETFEVNGVSAQVLADKMVGRKVNFKTTKLPAQPTKDILKINNLVVNDNRNLAAVKNFNLTVAAGEIVGIAGIDGNGQTELVEALTGLRPSESGSITLNEQSLTKLKPRKIMQAGVAHVPEDRLRFGLQSQQTLAENLVMQTYYQKPYAKRGILNYAAIREHARELMAKFDVRASSEMILAGELSGGNQQKAVIARELDRDADLIIAAQPTRGLDVGAIEYIHKQLIAQRDANKAVLVISFELDEILNLADRIAVINHGEIIGIVDAKTTNKQELGLLMTGVSLTETRNILKQGVKVNAGN